MHTDLTLNHTIDEKKRTFQIFNQEFSQEIDDYNRVTNMTLNYALANEDIGESYFDGIIGLNY